MQQNKNIWNSLPAVNHKNKRNMTDSSEKVVHPAQGGIDLAASTEQECRTLQSFTTWQSIGIHNTLLLLYIPVTKIAICVLYLIQVYACDVT